MDVSQTTTMRIDDNARNLEYIVKKMCQSPQPLTERDKFRLMLWAENEPGTFDKELIVTAILPENSVISHKFQQYSCERKNPMVWVFTHVGGLWFWIGLNLVKLAQRIAKKNEVIMCHCYRHDVYAAFARHFKWRMREEGIRYDNTLMRDRRNMTNSDMLKIITYYLKKFEQCKQK